jgi:ribosomal protein S18 acetylase RimI-like enzyme
MIEINSMDPSRWRDYRSLRLAALEQEPAAFGSSVEDDSRMTEADWRNRMPNTLFAFDVDRPIGMIAFAGEPRRKTRHIVGIYGVYVDRGYRGQGAGRKLLDGALAAIAERPDVVKIKLTVNAEQTAAVKLYESCGFEAVGRLHKELNVDGRFYDELVMERILTR